MDDTDLEEIKVYYKSVFYQYYQKNPECTDCQEIDNILRTKIKKCDSMWGASFATDAIISTELTKHVDLLGKILEEYHDLDYILCFTYEKALRQTNWDIIDCFIQKISDFSRQYIRNNNNLLSLTINCNKYDVIKKIIQNTQTDFITDPAIINSSVPQIEIFELLIEEAYHQGIDVNDIFNKIPQNTLNFSFSDNNIKILLKFGFRIEAINMKKFFSLRLNCMRYLVSCNYNIDITEALNVIANFDKDLSCYALIGKMDFIFEYCQNNGIVPDSDIIQKIIKSCGHHKGFFTVLIKHQIDLSFIKPSQKTIDFINEAQNSGLDEYSIIEILLNYPMVDEDKINSEQIFDCDYIE